MKSKNTKIELTFTIITTFTLLLLATIPVNAETQTATLPNHTIGDKWTYNVNLKQPTGMTGTLTSEVTETANSYTEITTTGGGTISGQGTSGTWTLKQYELKFGLSTAKSETAINAIIGTVKLTRTIQTTYNPPLEFNKGFPLAVGKNWSSATTETINSKSIINGETMKEAASNLNPTNFVVLRTEKIKVTAGEFETFVIKTTKNDGTSSEIYYSPTAQMQIKELDYDMNGNLVTSMELQNYSLTNPSIIPLEYMMIAVIISCLAGISAVYMLFNRSIRGLNPKQL